MTETVGTLYIYIYMFQTYVCRLWWDGKKQSFVLNKLISHQSYFFVFISEVAGIYFQTTVSWQEDRLENYWLEVLVRASK